MTRYRFLLPILVAPALAAPAVAAEADPAINALLAPIRDKYKLPGLVGGVVQGDKLMAAGAVGVRKQGVDVAITVDDKLHMGSCTKAMTATLLATLVEEGKLSWDTTLAGAFPDEKDVLHADLRGVTLRQLLTHRSGLPANVDYAALTPGASGLLQRRALFRKVLRQAPEVPPGTKHHYSNVGYAVAGMMAESATKKTWEELMRERLFKPLGLTSAGFGSPGPKGRTEQPWGHRDKDGKREALQDDNPPVIAPAGAVHLSLSDWARFAGLHMRGPKGEEKLLKAETFRRLHTPPEGEDYACGWLRVPQPWARGKALTHAGSNTMWVANVWAAPERDVAFLVVTNAGGDAATKAIEDAVAALVGHWLKKAGE